MRRVKIGDVLALKTERGYRIIQYAYRIERYGRYVKVFHGFYNEKPDDLTTIMQEKCSYIIIFNVSPLFKKGILEFWGNYDFCILEPFPELDLSFRRYGKQMLFYISNSTCHQENEEYIGDSSGFGIPEKYRNVCLLNKMPSSLLFLHLLSSDFDLKHFDYFWPTDEEINSLLEKYNDVL